MGSGRGARRAGTTSRPGTLGVAPLPLLVALVAALACAPGLARADDVEHLRHPDGRDGVWLTLDTYRESRVEHVTATECPVQLRVAEQRLAVAAGDVLVLQRALDAQSGLVVDLRRELRAASAWGPRWAWWLLGVGVGVAGSVVLALSL